MSINTPEYWDKRFSENDWTNNTGNLQSLGFALNALQQLDLPKSLRQGVMIHDYGCAQGDGTALLKANFPQAQVIGFDYSIEGVKSARKRWVGVTFEVGDITQVERSAHIIWSSHVLEHVTDPVGVVNNLLTKCAVLVIIVPFISDLGGSGEHAASLPTEQLLKQLPKPILHKQYITPREDPVRGGFLLETNVLLMWEGTLATKVVT